jgi:hypothetical protein
VLERTCRAGTGCHQSQAHWLLKLSFLFSCLSLLSALPLSVVVSEIRDRHRKSFPFFLREIHVIGKLLVALP